MTLERVQERLKLDNGAIVEVYLKKRSRRIYTVRVTWPDGTTAEKSGYASMPAGIEWGIERAREGHHADAD